MLAGVTALAHPGDELNLRSLLYGHGFAAERSRAARESAATRAWKEPALDAAWLTLRGRVDVCRPQHDALAEAFARHEAPLPDLVPVLSVLRDGEQVRVACGTRPEGYASPDSWIEKQPVMLLSLALPSMKELTLSVLLLYTAT